MRSEHSLFVHLLEAAKSQRDFMFKEDIIPLQSFLNAIGNCEIENKMSICNICMLPFPSNEMYDIDTLSASGEHGTLSACPACMAEFRKPRLLTPDFTIKDIA